jgi:hypothetical protein
MANKYWRGGKVGYEGKFLQDLLSKTCSASAVTELNTSPTRVRIPCAHAGDFSIGDIIYIEGTDNYDGVHEIVNINSNDSFDIETSYIAETLAISDTVKCGNWQDIQGIPVTYPVTGDTIIFDGTALICQRFNARHTEGKHWNCIDSITRADTGGNEYLDVYIGDNYTGNIGIDSIGTKTPWHLDLNASGTFIFEGNTKVYIECSEDNAIEDSVIPLLIHNSNSGYLNIASDINDVTALAKFTEVRCLKAGVLELEANTYVATLKTFNKNVTIYIGENCVDNKLGDIPIDLYIGVDDKAAATNLGSILKVSEDTVINFGAASIIIEKA